MAIPVTNFGLVTVSGTYAADATSVTLETGDGSKLPDTTGGYRYPLNWWNATDYAHVADDPNREIVLVTGRSGDVLTVTRGQEGTSASTKNTAGKTYRMSLGVTKAMWEDLRVNKSTHQGVVLRTARSSVDASRVVELVTCEYIVMDDGVALRNDSGEWSGKYADISLAGAHGLDTGTEDAAQWYEIYAIAKEDGTRDLLLHKSHKWSYDDFNTSGEDASQNVRQATANSIVSQGFQLFDSSELMAVVLPLLKVGSPTGVISLTIHQNNAGNPGSVILQSHYLDVSRLSTVRGEVIFTFPRTGTVLSGATQYHMALQCTSTIDGMNYVLWRMDGSAGTYANGSKAVYNGSSWTADTDDDMIFSLIVESGVTAVVYPSGYTKKCLLGWVYNDPFYDFVPFIQKGTTRRTANVTLGNSQAVLCADTAEAKLFTDFLPPVECLEVLAGATGTGIQAGIIAVGGIDAADISVSGVSVGAQAVLVSGTTADRLTGSTPVLIERGMAMIHGTVDANLYVIGFSW